MKKKKTGINFERCNVGSAEVHNSRNQKYMDAVNASPKKKYSIFEDQTKNNSTWVNSNFKGKTLPELLDEYREMYRQKIHQAPQEEDVHYRIKNKKTGMWEEKVKHGWAPIREGICPIKKDTTIADFQDYIEWMRSKGIEIIRIDLHLDEGHTDEYTNERRYNYHAHVIASWLDPATAKTRKLTDFDCSEMQTQIANSLGMERGEFKEITGANHLTPDEYRAKAAAKKAHELEAMAKDMEQQLAEGNNKIEALRTETMSVHKKNVDSLVHLAKNTIHNYDLLAEKKLVNENKDEKIKRDELERQLTIYSSKEFATIDELYSYGVEIRNLIFHVCNAVERIGNAIQKISSGVSFWKKDRLAHEADLQAQVANAEAKARKATSDAADAVRDAENAQKRADALICANAKKEKELNAAMSELEKKIADSVANEYQKGYEAGKVAGQSAEKEKFQKEMQNYTEQIEKLKMSARDARVFKEFFRQTNPFLANAELNIKELTELKEWPLTREEIVSILSGKVLEKTYCETRNFKQIKLPVRIEVAASDQGNMKVWYNDTTKEKCLLQLREEVVKRSKGDGMSVSR